MRLTVRTLLAWRDRVLSEEDQRDLDEKVLSHDDAQEIEQRIERVLGNLDLPSPRVDAASTPLAWRGFALSALHLLGLPPLEVSERGRELISRFLTSCGCVAAAACSQQLDGQRVFRGRLMRDASLSFDPALLGRRPAPCS